MPATSADKPSLVFSRTAPSGMIDWLIKTLCVAVAYYVTGRLGLLLAIPPGFATAVWPPAGLALAGALLFGYRIWPGIWLGSFLVNLWVARQNVTSGVTYELVYIPGLIGFGATLQAVLGAWLVRRLGAWPNPFCTEREVGKFLLLAGLAACTVNATWSVSTLWAAGVVKGLSGYVSNWWTWWVGDTIGVIIIAPLALMWRGHAWTDRDRLSSVAVPLGIASAAVVALFAYAGGNWAILACGMLLVGLLEAFLLVVTGRSVLMERAEDKLRRQALLFANLYDAVIITDSQGLIVDCNPAAERMFGYAAAELIGRSPEMLGPKEEGPQLTRVIQAALAEGQSWSDEVRFVTKTGAEGVCAARVAPLCDADGQLLGALSVNRDVTGRKLAERALAERAMHTALAADVGIALTRGESLARALQQCAESLVHHLDAAFARIWVYHDRERMLHLLASAGLYTHLDGRHSRIPLGVLKIGAIAEKRMPHLTNAVVGDCQIDDQEWARREGMVAFAGHPLVVEDRLVGVVAVFARHPLSEATLAALDTVADGIAVGIERKRAEEALRESQRRLQDILDNTTAVVYLKDLHGRYLLINRRYEELFHVKREHAVGKTDYDIFAVEAADAFRRNDLKVLAARVPLELEEVAPHDDGLHTYISLKFPMFDASGAAYGLCGISTDITERKLTEEREREHHSELAHASRLGLLGHIVAGWVHELGQPLAAIQRYADGCLRLAQERGGASPELLAALVELCQTVDVSARNVRRLKEFLRKRPPKREPVDLAETVREAVGFIEREALDRRVSLRLDLAEGLPRIMADRIQLQQVLLNLALNGLQAMREDPRELTIQTRARGDGAVEIAVRDTGCGIPAEVRDRLFEPFFSTKPEGLGMGLSISLSIVQGLGGQLWSEPNGDRGAVFRLRLPTDFPALEEPEAGR